MSTGYSGKDVIAAWKKGAVWGTAVQAGAGEALAIKTDGINHSIEPIPDDAAGQDFRSEQDQGLVSVSANPTMDMRYQGPDRLLAAVMGAAAAPSQQGATAAYEHVLTLASDLDGIFGTLAVGFGAKAAEIPSAKVVGFTLSGEVGQPLQLAVEMMGDDLVANDGGTNTIATLASATLDDEGNRVLFSQGVFLFNAASGAALDSGDEVKPRAFQLSFRRPHSSDYEAGSSANTIMEPTPDGFVECTLRLEWPRYEDDTWQAIFAAGTAYKADITFTGSLIADTYYYTLQLELPRLVPATYDRPQVNQAGKFSGGITFNCLRASAAPTGMSVTNPFQCTVMNQRTTTALA